MSLAINQLVRVIKELWIKKCSGGLHDYMQLAIKNLFNGTRVTISYIKIPYYYIDLENKT